MHRGFLLQGAFETRSDFHLSLREPRPNAAAALLESDESEGVTRAWQGSTMPIKPVFQTQIDHVSILHEHGNFDAKLGKGLIPDDDAVKLYEHMVICRQLDEVAFKLQ